MAFDKREIIDLTRILILVIVAFPWTASANIDCGGKAFHCINSTHFMICVDLGSGVSSTIDGFVIPCPPSTVCRGTNHFECEFLIPVTREQVASITELDVTELPSSTAAMSTTSATTVTQAQNDISALSTTEVSQYSTDLSAINTTEQPHATDIGVTNTMDFLYTSTYNSATNTTEFLQATTDTTAYNLTESLQTATEISATELPPVQIDTSTSVLNISRTPTEIPQASTDISAPNRTEVLEAQTANVFVTTESFQVLTANATEISPAVTDISVPNRTSVIEAQTAVTAERFQASTGISEANTTELPPVPRDTSASSISQATNEFSQAPTDVSAPIVIEIFQAQTANTTELPLVSIDTSAPNTSQAPSELPQALTDISAPNIIELLQAQMLESVSVTTERFQASAGIIEANTTELPPAPTDFSALNISQAPTEFPQAPTDISAPNRIELLQGKTLVSLSVTTERFQVSTGISEANITELPPTIIDINALNIYQAPTEFPQSTTDISALNRTELPRAQTAKSAYVTTDSLQTTTDISATELPTAPTDFSALNITQTSTEFPQVTTDISAPIMTELFQKQTEKSASVTTERLQASTNVSEANVTELPPIPIHTTAPNIPLTSTEFPQATTDISAPIMTELFQEQTEKSASVTTERLQVSTNVIKVNVTEIPPVPIDISAPNITQTSTEFPQATTDISAPIMTEFFQEQTEKSASVTTERLQASTNLSKANVTELPPVSIDTSTPNVTQTSTEFPQATTGISAPIMTELFQEQTEKSVFITSESFQVSKDVTDANTTEVLPALIDITASNNITEISYINSITTTTLPQTQTNINVPNTYGITQAPTDTIAPNTSITKIEATADNSVHSSTTESSQISTDIITTSTLTDMSTPIIIEHFEIATNHNSAFIITSISQKPNNISGTNKTDAVTDIRANNNTELSQKPTEVSTANTTLISQTLTNYSAPIITEISQASVDLSATNTTVIPQIPTDTSPNNIMELSQALTDVSATNIIEFLQATADITAYNPTEGLQTLTDMSATEFLPAVIDISTPSIAQTITEFTLSTPMSASVTTESFQASTDKSEAAVTELPPAQIDISLPKTTEFSQSPIDIGVPNTTEFSQATNTTDKHINDTNDVQSLVISKVLTDSTTFDTTQTHANTLSHDITTESVSSVNANPSTYYNNVDITIPTRITSGDTLTSEISLIDTDLNIITNPDFYTTPSIVQSKVPTYSNTSQVSPNETTHKDVMIVETIEAYKNLIQDVSTTSVGDSIITQNITITTSEPILTGLEKVSTNSFIEPITFDGNTYSELEPNKTIEPDEKIKVQLETNVEQSWTISLGEFTTSLFSGNSEIITEPIVTSNTEKKLPAVTAKSTETLSGIDTYTPNEQITESNNIVQQSLNTHNTVVVTNQHSNIPMAGYIDSQGSKNQDAVTEQSSDLTNVNYFDKGLSTSDMTKSVLETDTGIEQGFVTEEYTTVVGINYITDVPVSTTEMSQLTSIPERGSQQEVLSTKDLHATLSPWALNTKLSTNIEQGVDIEHKVENKSPHDFSKGPDANVGTASQNTFIKQGGDMRSIDALSSVVDNVRTITQNTTVTKLVAEPITSTNSKNLISVNELALPVSHIQVPVEQNVDTINIVFTNKTDLNNVIVSNSSTDKMLNAPLNNIDIKHGAHYVQNTLNDTVRSYSTADNVPTTNKQNAPQNQVNIGHLEETSDIISTKNISSFLDKDYNDTNVFSSLKNGNQPILQNRTKVSANKSNALDAMSINTQIISQNSSHIVDVEQNTDLNVFLSSFGTIQTASRNNEGITVPLIPVTLDNFTLTLSFDVTGTNDTNVDKAQRSINDSSASPITDNLSQASLSKVMNVKQETTKTDTNPKDEDLKLLPDLQQRSQIKSIKRSDTSASTSYSQAESIIPNKASSARVNAPVIVKSQAILDVNDNLKELVGRDFVTTTENINDEKLNLNQEKSIGNMEEVVVPSPLLDLIKNVTMITIAPKIKLSESPKISSIKFGNPDMELIPSTQSSLEKIESMQSVSDAVIILSKDSFQAIKQETQGTRTQASISEQTAGYTKSPSSVVQNESNTKETLVSELIKVPANEQLVYSNTATIIKEVSTVTEPENEFTHQPPNEVKQILESHNDDINLAISSNIANSNTETRLNKEVDLYHTVILATKHIETSTSPIITSKDITPNVLESKETNINNSTTTNIDKSLQSNTATNMENNSKLKPTLAHANISLKITTNTSAIMHRHIPKKSEKLYCRNQNRGRYSDREDCSKFYICIGRLEPIIGRCPANTVFSDIKKQCTKNMSHCIRENEFKCTSAGRYSDILQLNIYYICVPSGDVFVRFKFQCQNGYHLNKTSVKCDKESEQESQHQTSISVDSKSEKSTNDDRKAKQDAKDDKDDKDDNERDKESNKSVEEFRCEEEGRFGDANNCRKYYVCTKRNKKSEFRRRKKKCDSDEVFHKEKKKCVDAESYEC